MGHAEVLITGFGEVVSDAEVLITGFGDAVSDAEVLITGFGEICGRWRSLTGFGHAVGDAEVLGEELVGLHSEVLPALGTL